MVQPAEVAGRLDPELVQHPGDPFWLGDARAHDRSEQVRGFVRSCRPLSCSGEMMGGRCVVELWKRYVGTFVRKSICLNLVFGYGAFNCARGQ
jgi:hypothetical protein